MLVHVTDPSHIACKHYGSHIPCMWSHKSNIYTPNYARRERCCADLLRIRIRVIIIADLRKIVLAAARMAEAIHMSKQASVQKIRLTIIPAKFTKDPRFAVKP